MISSLALSANEANNILNQITTQGKEHWTKEQAFFIQIKETF
jgi:hypothetical protein